PVRWPDGRPYQNTATDWTALCEAARDAVALSLVPSNILTDHRNDAPTLQADGAVVVPIVSVDSGLVDYAPVHRLPELDLDGSLAIPQCVQVELWSEKSTVLDILLPLASRYDLNIVTASGEISATLCRSLVDRVERDPRPYRILYIADF